jgi:tripartite-type tricarboxylate transporter receptor subunit TctC
MQKIFGKWLLPTLVTALALASPVQAQTFPSKPITIVVPFGPGSGTDVVARTFAQAVSAELGGATIVVDNRAGANGFIAAQAVARAPADGHTLFLTTNTTQAANPHLFKKLPYDPVSDFTPVTALGKGAMLLVVSAASPINTIAEFFAQARKQPGKLTFGSGSSSSRVAGEMLQQMADLKLLHVPYKSNPAGLIDLIGGQIDVMFADTATALPLVQTGKIRALAYTGPQRLSILPSIPTVREAGVKNYELSYWLAVYSSPGTPAEIVRRLNTAFIKAAHSETVGRMLARAHFDIFTTTPEGLAKFQQAETESWGRIIKNAGIEAE